jgi:hypothetical protein
MNERSLPLASGSFGLHPPLRDDIKAAQENVQIQQRSTPASTNQL